MVSVNQPSGGKRSLDAELNLVPFIDLLSMCICFLLMTAVWAEVAALEVKQARGTQASKVQKPYEMVLVFKTAQKVEFQLKQANKVVKKETIQGATVADLKKNFDQFLSGLPILKEIDVPVGSAMVTPATGVNYDALVAVIDTLRTHRVQNLGVVPIGGQT